LPAQHAVLLIIADGILVRRIFIAMTLTTTTPSVEAPDVPSAATAATDTAATPLSPETAQLVPGQGNPTLEQPDVSAPFGLQVEEEGEVDDDEVWPGLASPLPLPEP